MADTFDDINREWNANGGGDINATNARLITAIGGADAATLTQQEAQARSQLSDPKFGAAAQARLDAIAARRSSLNGGMVQMQPPASGQLPKPVIAAPTPGAAVSGTNYTQNGSWTPKDDSSATRVAGMLTAGSEYIDAAQADAAKEANRRGLVNSSMAAGAGTLAGIRAAQPFALQDAAQDAAKNLSKQQGYQALEQGAQQGSVTLGAAGLQSDTQLTLQTQADKAAADRLAATNETQKTVAGMNNASQEKVSTAQNASQEKISAGNNQTAVTTTGMNNTTQTNVTNLNNASQQNVNLEQVRQNNRSIALTGIANADSTYASQYNAIMSNANLSADERGRQLESIKNQRDATVRIIQTATGITLDWSVGGETMPATKGGA
jgi:hypothetical protein